jgi:predicted DCC family thiol-disulfide oxidoreductase YuxK
VLLYDGDCRFCVARAEWLAERLRTPVLVVPWQAVDHLDDLGVTPADLSSAACFIDVFGRRHRGHAAIARALRLCRWPLPLLGVLLSVPPGRGRVGIAHQLVARHRHRRPAGVPR